MAEHSKHPERPKRAADKAHCAYITTTYGISGFFAVMLWWNDEREYGNPPFWEPWTSGLGRYPTREEAAAEGRDWAAAEGLEFKDG